MISRLKNAPISCCRGFGRPLIVVGHDAEPQVDESFYGSVEQFDGRKTPDVEFDHLYDGRDLLEYKNKTKKNLHELGMALKCQQFSGHKVKQLSAWLQRRAEPHIR